jgi:hypothetical protein
MRVRLLIDVTLDESKIPQLAERIADQPIVKVKMTGWEYAGGTLIGRFMGAQPVMKDEVEEMKGLEGTIDKRH